MQDFAFSCGDLVLLLFSGVIGDGRFACILCDEQDD
jgi:hypothetical protein